MSENQQKSLVDRYYKWELFVLITSLLLIFWQVFGLNNSTPLPLLNVKLQDPNKFPMVVSIILAAEFLFLMIEWKQSEKLARHSLLAKVRFGIVTVLAIAAIWINLPAFTKGTPLADVSRFWYVFYFLIGLLVGALTSVLIFVTLMIRVDDGASATPLSKIPVATRCVYMGCWPAVLLLLLISYVGSSYAPFAVLRVAPWVTAIPILYFVVENVVSLFFFYDAEGHHVSFHKRILKLREIFKTHDYLYLLNNYGRYVSAQVVKPANASPQQEQEAYQQHISKIYAGESENTGSPLHNAAFAGRQNDIERLLKKGADINSQAGPGWTPLLAAVAQGYPKMVKFLLEHGANPDIANLQKITPLMFAARYGNFEIAKTLLDYGANLELQNIYKETALAAAVRKGEEPLVRLFLSKGASINTCDIDGLSPLEMAHKYGHGKIARILRKKR